MSELANVGLYALGMTVTQTTEELEGDPSFLNGFKEWTCAVAVSWISRQSHTPYSVVEAAVEILANEIAPLFRLEAMDIGEGIWHVNQRISFLCAKINKMLWICVNVCDTLELADPFDEGKGDVWLDEDLDDHRTIAGLSADCFEEARRVQAARILALTARCICLPCFVVDVSELCDIRVEGCGCGGDGDGREAAAHGPCTRSQTQPTLASASART
jgi:hypothetical protein